MLKDRERSATFTDILYLTVLSTFFLIYRLWDGSLASWDEAVYATVAKEIVLSGDWFNLTLGGTPWVDKPPLAIWFTALFYKIFGIHELSARLFSSLCGVGTVLVTYLLGRELFNRWTGFLGALVLLSSMHYFRYVRFGMMDSPLTFFMSLSLFFFWTGRYRNRYLLFSGVAAGLALMTKSWAAFFIFPIVWIHCWWAEEWEPLRRSSYWIGVIIAAAIALPWNLFEMWTRHGSYLEEAVFKHVVLRATQAIEGHSGNFYFYIRTLVNKYHPWVLVAIFSAPYFLFRAIKDRESEKIFLVTWMFFIFGVITLMQTKLPWYILPVYPPLSLTVGWALARLIDDRRRNWVRALFVGVMGLHVVYSHIFDQDYSRPIKGIAPVLAQKSPAGERLFLYRYHETPAVLFYTGRVTEYVDDENSFMAAAQKYPSFTCLVLEKDIDALKDKFSSLGLSVQGVFEDARLVMRAPVGAAR